MSSNPLYIVTHTFSNGDMRSGERIYKSREDAEIVARGKSIDLPDLTYRVMRIVEVIPSVMINFQKVANEKDVPNP